MKHARKRRGQRIKTRLKALFATREHSGDGLVVEISYSGARLENTDLRPPRGTDISIYVWLDGQEEPFELVGRVAGIRPAGFAVEYEKPGQAICQMVDLAAAAVGTPPEEEKPAPAPLPREPRSMALDEIDFSIYEMVELERHASRVAEEIARRRRAAKERLADELAGGS